MLLTINKKILYYDVRLSFVWEIPYWKNLKEHLLDNDTIIDSVRLQLDSLMITDQQIREKCGGYNNAVCNMRIKEIDSINILKYIEIISKHDYPRDDLFGYDNPRGSLPSSLIIIHNYQWNRNWIDPILKNKISEGKLDPRRFWPDYGRTDSLFQFQFIRFKNNDTTAYMRKLDDSLTVKKINQARELFFLETIDEYRAKIKFNLINKEYAFYNPQEVPYLNVPPEIESGLKSNSIEVKASK